MAAHANARSQKYRQGLRERGLRPIQLWVYDTRQPGFQEEVDRQLKLLAEADAEDGWWERFSEACLMDAVNSGVQQDAD